MIQGKGNAAAAVGALAGATLLNRQAGLFQAKAAREKAFQDFSARRAQWQPGPASARFGDLIKHKSFWAALAGAIVGAALTIATGVATIAAFGISFPLSLLAGGLALYVAFQAAPLIEKFSDRVTQFVDNLFTTPDGAISNGSPNVIICGEAAARAGVTLPTEPTEVAEPAPTDLQNMIGDFSEGNYLDAAASIPGALMEAGSDVMDWGSEVVKQNIDTLFGRNDASTRERLEAASCWLTGGPIVAELVTMAGGHGAIKKDVNFPEMPGDTACCKEGKPPRIAQGSGSVFINGQPAARKDDKLECSAVIKTGAQNVFIGGGQLTYLDIDAEFPPWMRKILGAINIASFLLPPAALGAKVLGRFCLVSSKLAGRLSPLLRGAMLGAQRALAGAGARLSRVAAKASDMARKVLPDVKKCYERIRKFFSDPIDVATGAYIEQRIDLRLGQTLPLEFIRYHDSTGSCCGLTGVGWNDNWSDHALVSAGGSFVDIYDHTGNVYAFNFTADEDLAWNVAYDYLTLRRREKVLELFDSRTLTSRYFYDVSARQNGDENQHFSLGVISDVHNNKIVFERDAANRITGVVHSDGIRLKLDYHSNGFLHKIIRYNGELEVLAQYQQDDRGRLIEADATQDYHLFYQYDNANRLIEWSDNDKTWVRFVYDEQNRCIATEGAEGYYCGTLSYGENYTDTVTADNCRTRYWRDKNYNIVAIETQQGHVTRFTYDANHNITSRTTPQGRQTFYEYEPHSQRLSQYTDEAGHLWRYEYNYQGRLSKITDPQGHEWQQAYNELGKPVHILSPTGEKTELSYQPDGLLASIVHPDSSSRCYSYDAHKRLNQITDESGRHYRIDYNRRDQPQTLVRPGEIKTHLRWQRHYRLSGVEYADRSTAEYQYDRHGNLICYIDGRGTEWRLEYGAFDLPIARTDALGNRWQYRYDRVTSQLTEVINPQGESYRYRLNQLGQVTEEVDYGGAIWRYAYDEDGNCISVTDGQGQEIRYDYDARGLCIASHSEEETIYYRYSETGQLLATEGKEHISYSYDDAQRLISEKHDACEILWRYPSHHVLEREIRLADGEALKTTWSYNATGQLTELKLPGGETLNIDYNEAGQEIRRSAAEGFILCQYYDAAGRPVRQRAGRGPVILVGANGGEDIPAPTLASQDRVYYYDARGNIEAVNDDEGQIQYLLNGNGQITEVRWPLFSETYDYDESGYLTRQSAPQLGYEALENCYEAGHRLAQQGRDWFEYDSGGRMTKRIVREEGFRPYIYEYRWNSRSQLTGFKKPDGETWHYSYDARGRRTAKWCDKKQRRTEYIWDNDTVAVIKEYRSGRLWHQRHLIFNGFELLAQQDCFYEEGAEPKWQTHFVTTNLNGLPLSLYTPAGRRAWQKPQTSLWGVRQERMPHLPEETLDPGLLFAGQLEDKESGLVYNRFRYYHPKSGCYLSPDPIGLAGGENTQGYVPNPVDWVDPLGLSRSSELTRGKGSGYAASVSPGGQGKVLAGHGGSKFGDKMIVPEGTSITMPRDGIRISDRTGKLLESGNIKDIIEAANNNPRVAGDLNGWVTYLPGSQIPDYILKPPVGLNIMSNSITVESSTYLSQLLKPHEGNVIWAACTEYFR